MKEDVATGGLAVYFPIKTFELRETTARIQRAVLLLHWLLIRHPCVVMIEVEDWGVFEDIDWFRLFCDGVQGCHSLKILRLNADIGGVPFYGRLLKACASLQHLEQLSFERFRDGQHVDNTVILAAVIGRNKNLSVFKVDEFAAVPGRTWTVLRAESVVCEESRDGRPRLDTLPPECWHAIRRYLSVADVVINGPTGS
ncbi:hypothetical protein HPB50_019403 [Hyalomma asiaticum]|uniref:Uncharacterized protein n=1 Tax=Hyalomma asiaticum TaxID=266040 RepID=A0ACB7S8E5_HYAAI|nr:hypothetical protein HPB50_019403 [Hyalomma asiaticum]